MDGSGGGELCRITGRHVADSYVGLLDDVLLPSLKAMRPGGAPHVFQQDNAPQHTARPTKEWIQEHQADVTVLDWPAKSPDLNIIENVWAIMEQELTRHNNGERLS